MCPGNIWILVEFISWTPLKLGFWDPKKSSVAVTLHCEDLVVNNYLFLKFFGEKSQSVLFSTFDKCAVFLLKYFED